MGTTLRWGVGLSTPADHGLARGALKGARHGDNARACLAAHTGRAALRGPRRREADVLLHVTDLSSANATGQSQTVEGILQEMKLADKPRITAVNKIDLLLDRGKTWDEKTALDFMVSQPIDMAGNTVLISADKGWGLNNLLEMIVRTLSQPALSSPVNDAL